MELNEIQVRCLFTAAMTRQMLKREWMLDAMTVVSEYRYNVAVDQPLNLWSIISVDESDADLSVGEIVRVTNKAERSFVGIVVQNPAGRWMIALIGDGKIPLFHRFDTFKFNNALAKEIMGVNLFTSSNVGETTLGRFLENVIVLQYPFNYRLFPYQNYVWKPDAIVKLVSNELIKIGTTMKVAEYKKFVDYLFYLNHITEISVPSMTEHSLTTHPDVPKVKAEFIAAPKDQMTDPIVIRELEDKLEALDKEWLGEDPSYTFFQGLGSKSFDIHRKKMFLTTGGIPAFDTSSGKFDYIPNSLSEGWTREALPSIANEIRKGSYERGIETAKGGAETKLVMRVFQDLRVAVDNCGTKRTIVADFGKTFNIKDFIGRWIHADGADLMITEDNLSKYANRTVGLYSPLTCECKNDFCFKCCGQRAKDLYAELIGIQVVKITSTFMNQAMKNMHGTVLKVNNVNLADILL